MGCWVYLLLCLVGLAHSKPHPQAKLPFKEYCHFYNYPVEEHVIETDDGYLLTFYRIQKKNSTIISGLKPLWLQHGLLDCSDTWLINDEDKAPGFILANAGFDVWFGNSRGNTHSRNHVSLNPNKDAKFWQFSFQEMADYDLPAGFKYIYAKTGQKIHYVGHSQGSMMMHVALSKNNPVVQSLMDKYFAFGPVAYVNHITSPLFKRLDHSDIIKFYQLRHINQFMPSFGWFQTDVGVLFCASFGKVCNDIMAFVMDANPKLDNYQRYDVLVGHDPAGTSLQNMIHWKQMVESGKFRAFDWGSNALNMQHYNQTTPPLWDLSKIRMKMRLFGGSSDELADITDLNRLWDDLSPGVREFYKIYQSGHCTFMWGVTTKPWMDDLFSMLSKSNHLTSMIV